MLKFMRKKTKSIFIYIVFGIIILVFVFWGLGGLKTDTSNVVASVNGKIITRATFLKTYQNQIDFYRNLYKDNFSQELLESLNLKKSVLDGMIDNALILQEAESLNLKVSKEDVLNNIKANPTFQQDGVFDKELYLRLLKGNRIVPGEYEEGLKEDILIKRLKDIIFRHINVSDTEARNFFDYEQRKINLQYITVDGTDFKDAISFTEDEAREYLEKNPLLFEVPEKFRLHYVMLNPKEFKGEREEAKKKASDVVDRALEEELSLNESAQRDGLKIEDAGLLTRDDIGKVFSREQKVAGEAMSLGVGKISQPVEGIEGIYILEIVEMKERYLPKYEEISQQVKAFLKEERAGEKAREASQELLKRVEKGEDLLDLAVDQGLKVMETGLFSKRNMVIPGPGIGLREGGAEAVFSLIPDAPFTVLSRGNKHYLLKLKEVQIPSEEEYKQAQDNIKKGLLELKRREAFSLWIKSLKGKSDIETSSF